MTRTPPTKKLKPRTLAQIYLDLARVEDLDDLLLAAASIKDHDPKWAAALVAEAAPVIPSTTDTLMLLNVAGALAGDPKHHAAATALMQQVSSRHLRKYERPEVASTWALVDMAEARGIWERMIECPTMDTLDIVLDDNAPEDIKRRAFEAVAREVGQGAQMTKVIEAGEDAGFDTSELEAQPFANTGTTKELLERVEYSETIDGANKRALLLAAFESLPAALERRHKPGFSLPVELPGALIEVGLRDEAWRAIELLDYYAKGWECGTLATAARALYPKPDGPSEVAKLPALYAERVSVLPERILLTSRFREERRVIDFAERFERSVRFDDDKHEAMQLWVDLGYPEKGRELLDHLDKTWHGIKRRLNLVDVFLARPFEDKERAIAIVRSSLKCVSNNDDQSTVVYAALRCGLLDEARAHVEQFVATSRSCKTLHELAVCIRRVDKALAWSALRCAQRFTRDPERIQELQRTLLEWGDVKQPLLMAWGLTSTAGPGCDPEEWPALDESFRTLAQALYGTIDQWCDVALRMAAKEDVDTSALRPLPDWGIDTKPRATDKALPPKLEPDVRGVLEAACELGLPLQWRHFRKLVSHHIDLDIACDWGVKHKVLTRKEGTTLLKLLAAREKAVHQVISRLERMAGQVGRLDISNGSHAKILKWGAQTGRIPTWLADSLGRALKRHVNELEAPTTKEAP